jgi:hypothetical protein
MDAIPDDTLRHMLGMLPVLDIIRMESVSRHWRDAIRSEMGAHVADALLRLPCAKPTSPLKHVVNLVRRRTDLRLAVRAGTHYLALCAAVRVDVQDANAAVHLIGLFPEETDALRPQCLEILASSLERRVHTVETMRALFAAVCSDDGRHDGVHVVDLGFVMIRRINTRQCSPEIAERLDRHVWRDHARTATRENHRDLLECFGLLVADGMRPSTRFTFLDVSTSYQRMPGMVRTELAHRGVMWVNHSYD